MRLLLSKLPEDTTCAWCTSQGPIFPHSHFSSLLFLLKWVKKWVCPCAPLGAERSSVWIFLKAQSTPFLKGQLPLRNRRLLWEDRAPQATAPQTLESMQWTCLQLWVAAVVNRQSRWASFAVFELFSSLSEETEVCRVKLFYPRMNSL